MSELRTRRRRLSELVHGPVLLVGNGVRARNMPANPLPFRQDSSFWYLSGCAEPNAALLLEGGHTTLYLPEPAADDALWHGHVEDFDALRERYGVDEVRPYDLETLRRIGAMGAHTLAVADSAINSLLDDIGGRTHRFDQRHLGSPELVDALIRLRRTKSAWEIGEMREAAQISARAHVLAMRMSKPGMHERTLTALFEGYLASHDCTPGYGTILTQDGHVLHHRGHDLRLEAGRLLLLDGGGELNRSGYGADITRTWAVSGRMEGRAAAAYDACLRAQAASIALCTAGTPYRDVHDASCRVLAEFLVDAGLLRGASVDEVLERHAHALFFPHGVGHLLGLDVHDLEAYGDLPAYPPGVGRPEPFGTRYLRLNLPLEAGWVVTVEPGFYVVPAILHDEALRARFGDLLVMEEVERWAGLGGIRIEDDVLITTGSPDVLTDDVPKDPQMMEALVGAGASIEEWFA